MPINIEQVLAAAERDDNTGICKVCGNEQQGVEPDARNYICEACGAPEVFGAEQILIESL